MINILKLSKVIKDKNTKHFTFNRNAITTGQMLCSITGMNFTLCNQSARRMTFSGLYLIVTSSLFAVDEFICSSVVVMPLALIDCLRPSSKVKSIGCLCSRLFKLEERKMRA